MVHDKIALVTGASRGIGKAIAVELGKNGIDVVINYNKDKEGAISVISELEHIGVKALSIKTDVSSFEECTAMINVIKKKFGYLDILVNNAGITSDKTLKNMTKEQWDLVINVNLNSMYNVTKNVLLLMRDGGSIINISSIVGIDGNFGQSNYSSSKAAIIGFTKSLAKELGKRKITVNTVAPGLIETDLLEGINHVKIKGIISKTPLGRIGQPEEVAYLVAFLASEYARYINGQVIRIDGGLCF